MKSVLIDKSKKPKDVEDDTGHKAEKVVGEFAQGEAAFYVGKEKPKCPFGARRGVSPPCYEKTVRQGATKSISNKQAC